MHPAYWVYPFWHIWKRERNVWGRKSEMFAEIAQELQEHAMHLKCCCVTLSPAQEKHTRSSYATSKFEVELY
jgi:hypothetical protein